MNPPSSEACVKEAEKISDFVTPIPKVRWAGAGKYSTLERNAPCDRNRKDDPNPMEAGFQKLIARSTDGQLSLFEWTGPSRNLLQQCEQIEVRWGDSCGSSSEGFGSPEDRVETEGSTITSGKPKSESTI